MTTTPSTSMPTPDNALPSAPQRDQPLSTHSDAAPTRNISVIPPMHNTMNVVHPLRCSEDVVTPSTSNAVKTSTAAVRVRGSRRAPSRRRNWESTRAKELTAAANSSTFTMPCATNSGTPVEKANCIPSR